MAQRVGVGVLIGAALGYSVARLLTPAAQPIHRVGGLSKDHEDGDEKLDKKERKTIEEILRLWFEGEISDLYNSRWFCPPGSSKQTDFDRLIAIRFSTWLAAAEKHELQQWTRSPRGHLALIILTDQFSRHIYREPSDRPRLKAIDGIALSLAEDLYTKGWQARLTVPEEVFALMPFRHSPTVESLKRVIARVDTRADAEGRHLDLLAKFRKTTLRKLQELQDRAPEDDEILDHYSFDADESSLASHRVAISMKAFLDRFYTMNTPEIRSEESFSCFWGGDLNGSNGRHAVAVSLSGGVDSMVIAKLLAFFQPHYRFEIVALHIDYANRNESGREAGYVEEWCRERGIHFRKRVVDEVTRGITARDAYEKQSREIRYGFYEQVLAEFNCPAVMLGHHRGDLQENVISNVMRGAGPLQLSGMGLEGLVNKVRLWRPFLAHPKEDIFDFAHQYGVPYFKDTTPTWSTRGKLRRQLVPLLKDMYGDGVLRNLSSLAHESDEARDLLHSTVLSPFWASVVHAPLAAHVDTPPFSHHGFYFWREALRDVVHSRGQGMLSDKGVSLLQQRISSASPRKTSNTPPTTSAPTTVTAPVHASDTYWLQLRKDYAVLLSSTRLFIFRPGVLRNNEPSYPPHGNPLPLGSPPLKLPPWILSVSVVEHAVCGGGGGDDDTCSGNGGGDGERRDEDDGGGGGRPIGVGGTDVGEEPPLHDLQAFCSGRFAYRLVVGPCKGCGSWPVPRVLREGYKKLKAWQHVDTRLKKSVPVVTAVCQTCDAAGLPETEAKELDRHQALMKYAADGGTSERVVLRVAYVYDEAGGNG